MFLEFDAAIIQPKLVWKDRTEIFEKKALIVLAENHLALKGILSSIALGGHIR